MQVHPQWQRRFKCDLMTRTCNLAVGTALLRSAVASCTMSTKRPVLQSSNGELSMVSPPVHLSTALISCSAEIYNDGKRGTVKGQVYAAKVLRVARRLRPGGTT